MRAVSKREQINRTSINKLPACLSTRCPHIYACLCARVRCITCFTCFTCMHVCAHSCVISIHSCWLAARARIHARMHACMLHTHTHTHILSITLTHTNTHTLSLSLKHLQPKQWFPAEDNMVGSDCSRPVRHCFFYPRHCPNFFFGTIGCECPAVAA